MTATSEPRLVSAEKFGRLGAWARRKPRIALMGEFSSGKSTLLNLLIGEDLLPTRVTATELPPVWFSHGRPQAYWVDRQGRRHPLSFGDFSGVPRSARYVRVHTPAPMLDHCDIIDTPGISDPNLEDESWRFPVGQANFVLWCTSATQAWRETERSTWLSLPQRLRASSVLVVTRADKLSAPGDQDKVARRLGRESYGLFGGMVFLASLDAVRGQAHLKQTGDASVWAKSGGAELEAKIHWGLAACRAARLDLLERYEPIGTPAARPTPAATVTPLPFIARPTAPTPSAAPTAEPADSATTVRLLLPTEPVRPRRVELPDIRRAERPAAADTAVDPLEEIRAGWKALRAEGERTEPAAVLRLTDPVERPLRPAPAPWPADSIASFDIPPIVEPPLEASAPQTVEEPAEATSQPEHPSLLAQAEEPAEAPMAAEPGANDPWADLEGLDPKALAAAYQTEEPAPPGSAAEPVPEVPKPLNLPKAVRIWRDIIAWSPEAPRNDPILAMIDQLLLELSRDGQPSGDAGATRASTSGGIRAA